MTLQNSLEESTVNPTAFFISQYCEYTANRQEFSKTDEFIAQTFLAEHYSSYQHNTFGEVNPFLIVATTPSREEPDEDEQKEAEEAPPMPQPPIPPAETTEDEQEDTDEDEQTEPSEDGLEAPDEKKQKEAEKAPPMPSPPTPTKESSK